MKKTALTLTMGLMVSGMASAEIAANIGATSNYVWRGVTQTDDGAAVSGGLDYSNESGVYAGTWTSNIDSDQEVDFYAGYSKDAVDVGAIVYHYSDADDFAEVYANYSVGPATIGAAYTVDKENTSTDENDLYYYVSASTELEDGWSLGGTLGLYDFDGSNGEYTHAQVDMSKSFGEAGDFTLSLSDLSNSGSSYTDEDWKLFVSYSKSF